MEVPLPVVKWGLAPRQRPDPTQDFIIRVYQVLDAFLILSYEGWDWLRICWLFYVQELIVIALHSVRPLGIYADTSMLEFFQVVALLRELSLELFVLI